MTALPCYIDLPEDRQEKARAALAKQIGVPIDDTSADAVIEQVWNALVGHETDEQEVEPKAQ